MVISIVGMLLAVSVPASSRFYESMQYRQAIQDVVSLLASCQASGDQHGEGTGRERLTPSTSASPCNSDTRQLPESFTMLVSAAAELGDRGRRVSFVFIPKGGPVAAMSSWPARIIPA